MADSDSDPLVTPATGGSAPAEGSGRRDRGSRGRGRGRSSNSGPGSGPGSGSGDNMLPERNRRSLPERMLVRLVATAGIVGIGVAIAAILVSSNTQGWEVGLIVSIVSVVLAAILWSSRLL